MNAKWMQNEYIEYEIVQKHVTFHVWSLGICSLSMFKGGT